MIEWLENFYRDSDLRQTLLDSFVPAINTYAEANGGAPAEFVQALAESYVDRHLGSSRAQLQELVKDAEDPLAALTERFVEWQDKRPGKVAANETVRMGNAIALEQMRVAGVKQKVWRTVGTCAFCKEMAGKTVAIEKDFVAAGDSLNPDGVEVAMTVTQPIGHPPLHQGCRCSIEPDTQLGLPGFGAPEFAVPVRKGYIDPQLRPNADPELAGMWDRLVDIHKQLSDRFGIESEWNGIVRRIDSGTAIAEWDGSVSINVARLVNEPHIREHNLIHEIFHTISKPSEAAFKQYAGWEEGLVDQMTILTRESVWDDIGVKLTAKQRRDLLEFDGDSSYGLYRYAWENMRNSTSLSADDFYGQMLRTPLENRPALAKRLGVSEFDLNRGLQILGGAD